MDLKVRITPEKDTMAHDGSFSKPLGSTNSDTKENNNNSYCESVVDLKKEISDLTGRLIEARNSRDSALRKNVQMQEDHLKSLKLMQDTIVRLEGNNVQKEKSVDTFAQLKELEDAVEKVRCEKTDLRLRMGNVAKENLLKDEKINELNQTIKKLKSSVHSLEIQKADLIESVNEEKRRNKEYEMQKGALNILDQQLAKCQASWEQTKDELNDEKNRCRDLERMLASIENELTTAKIDMRLLTTANKDFENKLAKETSASAAHCERIKELEHGEYTAKEKAKELEAEVTLLKTKLEEQVLLCSQNVKLIEEQGSQMLKVTADLTAAIKELEECKTLLTQYEQYKASNATLEELLKEKDQSLTEKDQTIANLEQSAKMLKEACVVLEKQLNKFETLLSKQKNEVDATLTAKSKAEEECMYLKKELEASKNSLNEMEKLSRFKERMFANVEASLKTGEAEKLNEIQNLESQMIDLKTSNEDMTEKMSDLLDRLDELQNSSDDLKKETEHMALENKLLREESSRSLTKIMELKESNSQLKTALEEAISKCESYKGQLESAKEDLISFEAVQAEKDHQFHVTLNQQINLIEHMKEQNEFLSAKSKKKNFMEKFFAKQHNDNKEPSSLLGNLPNPLPASTPKILVQEHREMKNLEDVASHLKNQLAQLQKQQKRVNHDVDSDEQSEEEEFMEEMKENILQTRCIFRDEESEIFDVNCVKNLCGNDSIYLFGCEQGLYSRKRDKLSSNYVVEIEGVGPVYQIDFVPSLNYALLIEGKDRRLSFVHLSLLRACAEAAACSKPKIKLHDVADLKDCQSFQVQKTADGVPYAAVDLPKYLVLLFWKKDRFVVHHRLKTPDLVTSMLATPTSVIFGCDKIFELDINNFTVEDFMDESDDTYAMLASRQNFNCPVAILDVSRSNMGKGDTTYRIEYLLCFPDFAIFVDAYGRRSRSEDIMWTKMPRGFYYKDTTLFVMHFNSVEVIELGPKSYTKTRVITYLDSIGTEIMDIPESKFISLPNARYLGDGDNTPVLFAGTLTKSDFEVFEIEAPRSTL